jgi:hypothetical protein
MIQMIGLMIGCYIITRVLEISGQKCGVVVFIACFITFFVCLAGMAGLMINGLSLAAMSTSPP